MTQAQHCADLKSSAALITLLLLLSFTTTFAFAAPALAKAEWVLKPSIMALDLTVITSQMMPSSLKILAMAALPYVLHLIGKFPVLDPVTN